MELRFIYIKKKKIVRKTMKYKVHQISSLGQSHEQLTIRQRCAQPLREKITFKFTPVRVRTNHRGI